MAKPQIILNNVSFHFPRSPVAIAQVNLTLGQHKYGLLGDNGMGKTTLLKLIAGELAPQQGTISRVGSINVVPQSHVAIAKGSSIADVLDVSKISAALTRIQAGSVDEQDYSCVGNHWDIYDRIEQVLVDFNLWPIDIHQPFAHLSGGQKTKVLLAKTRLFSADFLLFDEPTNNLDYLARENLYQFIESTETSLLVVSHDRTLLNKLNRIIEITAKGIQIYGGNYDFYRKQKDVELSALARKYSDAVKIIKQVRRSVQNPQEKQERLAGRGKKAFRQGKMDKLTAKSKKGRSEKTNKRMTCQAERIINSKQADLALVRDKMEIKIELDIMLAATSVANAKVVLNIKELVFKYVLSDRLLLDNFTLQIIGPSRVAITGINGCGKSTLIKLIRKQLLPQSGTIDIGVQHVAYLDQQVSFLDRKLSLVENFLKLNANSSAFDAYCALASFKFRNKEAETMVEHLSGGERMRAGLAISLMAKCPAQLIILDEPTNHLDLNTIEAIESALQCYQGAILAVSHDEKFLENIRIDQRVKLGSDECGLGD